MIKFILWRIFTAPLRFYYYTWSFILTLFGKRVPKHLREKFESDVEDLPTGKIVSYRHKEI
jgi:hypothetical protein